MKNKILVVLLYLFLVLVFPATAFAVPPGPGAGPIFSIPNILQFTNITQLIDRLVQLAFFVAGLAFFVNFLIGGVQWTSAGGDAKAMDSARKRITNSLIGLIIVVAAFSITQIVSNIFGISITGGFRFF